MKFHNLLIAFSLVLLSNCGDDDKSPTDSADSPNGSPDLPAPLTTPEALMDNLTLAMRNRDIDIYESLLSDQFWFTETDCTGEIIFANGLEEELELMGGSRDGSSPGIFDVFRTFEYEFTPIRRYIELGTEFPNAFDGDPDGHPEEDWEVFRGRVFMLLLQAADEGFRVEQEMSFKLHREGDEWKLVRWVDDPLAGDCGEVRSDQSSEKVVRARSENDSWGRIKTSFSR